MQEMLIMFACLNSVGCSETSGAYYQSHPEIQEMVKVNEKKAKEYIGPLLVESMGPVVLVMAGGTGNIILHRNVNFQFNKNTSGLVFNRSF